MKQMVAQVCQSIVIALLVCFCLGILFGQSKGNGIQRIVAELINKYQKQEIVSENHNRMMELMEFEAFQVQAKIGTCVVGRPIMFQEYIQVRQNEKEDWRTLTENSNISLEILDIRNEGGESLGLMILAEEFQGEEIAAPVEYSKETGKLCFYQSGCYNLRLRITDSYGRDQIKELKIPVEVG